MDAITALSDLYLKNKETENSKRDILEMERIEEEFTSTYEAYFSAKCLQHQFIDRARFMETVKACTNPCLHWRKKSLPELESCLPRLHRQRKIPKTMRARYQRWMFENSKEESVISLRTWVLQEAEFQTIASEKVRGVEGKLSVEPTRSRPRHGNQSTFFGETNEGRKPQKLHCQECGKRHCIWSCWDLIQKSVPERWSVAKRHQLCFRCLGQGHAGKSCPRRRPYGQDKTRSASQTAT